MLVAIDAATARPFRVVAVKHFEPFDADEPIELFEGVAIASLCRDVVSRRDEVTRVEADADAPRASNGQPGIRSLQRRTFATVELLVKRKGTAPS